MLFQIIKAALIIAFLMIGWISLQYIVRRKKNLSVDCDLMEGNRGCGNCSHDANCSHRHK